MIKAAPSPVNTTPQPHLAGPVMAVDPLLRRSRLSETPRIKSDPPSRRCRGTVRARAWSKDGGYDRPQQPLKRVARIRVRELDLRARDGGNEAAISHPLRCRMYLADCGDSCGFSCSPMDPSWAGLSPIECLIRKQCHLKTKEAAFRRPLVGTCSKPDSETVVNTRLEDVQV